MRKPILSDVMARLVDEAGVRSRMNQSRRRVVLEAIKTEVENATGQKVSRIWLGERGEVHIEYDKENPSA